MNRKNLFEAVHRVLFPGAEAAAFAGERLMVNHVVLAHGTEVPAHSHPEEQITLVLEGRIAFQLGDEVCELGPGDAIAVPAGVPHAVRALMPSAVLDVFTPVRADLLEKLG